METVRTSTSSNALLWFPSSTSSNVSVVDIIQRFYGFRRRHHPTFVLASVVGLCMVSVVAGNHLFMDSVVSCFNGFRRGRKPFFVVSISGLLVVDSAAAGGSNILECIERFLVLFVCF